MADLRTAGLLFTASSLCLALLQLTQADYCGVRVQRVAVSGSANLSCAGLAGEERSVTLHKEGRLVHNATFRGQNAVLDVDQNMRLRVEGHAVVYQLRQVTDREAGLYTCALEKIYPPAFKKETRCIALFTDGHSPAATNQSREQPHPSRATYQTLPDPQTQTQTQTLWLACVGLSVLCVVLVVFILALGVRHKLRRNTEDSEYINTRPGESRKPKGVQHPKWVHA